MKRTLHVARNLKLPVNAVTQTFAFMGRRGSGKSYAAGKLAEEMLDVGAQVVVLDPVGTWWGLRTLANGKPGYSIPVLGGPHGDIPLEPTGGVVVAKFIVDTGTSMIVDLSRFRKNDRKRFVVDFAEELFHRKKDAPSALHVIIDEAQHFCPQRIVSGDERLLGAVSDLTLMGRNYGIGVSLISQRPQKVNKDVLNQTECLFAFQMTGPHERKAIKEWIADKGIHDANATVITKLPTGTAIVWSPQWLDFYGKVKVNKKRTADTSATPEPGKKVPKRKLAKVDLKTISVAMAETIESVKQRDPKQLRKQLNAAKLQIENLKQESENRTVEIKETEIEVPVITSVQLDRLEHAIGRLHDMGNVVNDAITTILSGLWETMGVKPATPKPPRDYEKPLPAPPRHKARSSEKHIRNTSQTTKINVTSPTARKVGKTNGLGKGPIKILAAIATLHPTPLSRNQVSTLSGFSVKSSTFSNYLSALRTGGYMTGSKTEPYALTEKGLAAVGDVTAPASTKDLLTVWLPKLPGYAKTMLEVLVAQYPSGLSRTEIADLLNQSSRSSTFSNYLSALTSNKLAEKHNGRYYASDSFFLS